MSADRKGKGKGQKRVFSAQHCENLKKSRNATLANGGGRTKGYRHVLASIGKMKTYWADRREVTANKSLNGMLGFGA